MKEFKIKRRTFLKSLAFVGGAVAAGELPWLTQLYADEDGFYHLAQNAYPFDKPETVIYSTCLQCHTACTIKGKIYQGVLVKITGNPYSPMNMWPQLSYDTPPEKAVKYDARLCPKGQAGIQSLYDPYRLRKVLKRKPGTKRGEGQWITIPFEQAIEEIVNGGNLFGEGHVPGLKEIWAVRDPKLMKELKKDAKAVAEGKMSLEEFKRKHKDHLDKLIDPNHPDLGPKNNQFVFLAGRIEHGRKEFSKRWLKDAFGSVNWYEHTTVCEQSHHIAYKEMTRKYHQGKWIKPKEHMKPDVPNAEFVIFFGTSPFECNFGLLRQPGQAGEGLRGPRGASLGGLGEVGPQGGLRMSFWIPLPIIILLLVGVGRAGGPASALTAPPPAKKQAVRPEKGCPLLKNLPWSGNGTDNGTEEEEEDFGC
ncbi:hypothetical protein FVE67_06865 [Thermosulfurimonas marina]|uniref:4Fe-4S Mo/W bis-MGD-type domain-containing protein n=1 Tax=Thermosulfurimonas marina TaxID=2047767 RepID=A0A6H1WTL1_9BACT|nr:hypothetical protein [Thermosulfurimonas marina]QJA06532.1 hypothetical protein FVE67_06865 [Thermosulfurimonas marina]